MEDEKKEFLTLVDSVRDDDDHHQQITLRKSDDSCVTCVGMFDPPRFWLTTNNTCQNQSSNESLSTVN